MNVAMDQFRSIRTGIVLIVCLAMPGLGLAAPVEFLPSSYLQSGDSPFLVANGGPFSLGGTDFFLEDFEDEALNTTGVSETSGNTVFPLTSPVFTDSVDADDGLIDGSGLNGTSFLADFHAGEPSLAFSFDALALGGSLPTHAGLVVTGLEGDRTMELRAFGPANTLIGSFQFDLLLEPEGGVSQDRFVGFSDLAGISRIELVHISNPGDQVEVDHLQYGLQTPIPVPGAALLFLSGLGFLSRLRCRKLSG